MTTNATRKKVIMIHVKVAIAKMQGAVLKNFAIEMVEIIDMIITQEGITIGMMWETVSIIATGNIIIGRIIIEMTMVMKDPIGTMMITEIDVIMNTVDLVVAIGSTVVMTATIM
jgi:hypothetical protein